MKHKLLNKLLTLTLLILGGATLSPAWATDVTVLSENFNSSSATGWTLSGKTSYQGSAGEKSLQLASSNGAGSATTPAFSSLVGTTATLTFDIASSGSATNTLTITGNNCKVNGSSSTTALTSAGSVTINITDASTSSTITFSAVKSGGCRIDNVVVYYTSTPTYSIIYSATNGSIAGVDAESSTVASGDDIAEGATVTLTATPSSGYEFSSWSVSGTGSTLSSTTDNPTTFTMGTANSTVTANFVASSTVATPSFTVSEGTYNAAQSVEINCGTDDATIYYTTDGTDPTTSSSVYSSAISVTQTTTIKAFAVKDGLTNSDIASATYTLKCVAPTFDPAAGSVGYGTEIALSTTTEGATIYYTTNGDIPTSSSSTYDSSNKPTVSGNQTFKAIATKTGWSDSDVSSAAYTFYYVITAESNNDEYGTVSGTTTITATPEDGYRVVAGDGGYTVTKGTATVTNNGDNTFSVSPSSNCTVQINFEAIPTHTVTFSVNGDDSRTATVAEGAAITFPTAVETTPGEGEFPKVINGQTFQGWYTGAYSNASVAPSYVNTATMSTGDVTYYTVYATVEIGDPTDVTLSNSTISSNSSKNSYSDDYNIENWTGRYMINNNGGVYSLQLGYNTDSKKSAYNSHLTTPNCPADIKSITIETQNSTASGRHFFLCDANNLGYASSSNATYGYGSLSEANGSVTINVSGSTKQIHIYPDGTAYIKTITLTYQSVSITNFTTDNRAAAGISYANATVDVKLSSGSTGQALTNTNSVSGITYSSSDETVATVNSSTGAITALLKAGSTTITATFAGNATYKPAEVSYDLNVTEKTPHGLAYATAEVAKLTTDDTFTNTLTNGNSLTVSYSSSETDVATVNSSTGVVTIKGAGSTTITATFAGNEDYEAGNASYTLTVSKATPTLSFASDNAIGREGEAFAGNALTNPAELTVSYSSSDTDVAKVDSKTGAITIVAAGTTTITASFAGNDTYTSGSASYTLKVLDTPTITVSNAEIAYGETYTYSAGVSDTGGTITISSGNSSVATVSDLVITPKACGEVEITVSRAENETYKAGSATFTLTVTAPEGKPTAPSSDIIATFDFSQNGWGIPTTSSTLSGDYTKGTQTVTISGTGYYYGSKALLLGKSGATLTLPAFDKPVTQIDVAGPEGASSSVKQNIYVGSDAVSTETTGANNVTNEYAIASNKQAAGTIYTLKVTSAHNTQITSIAIHQYVAPTATVKLNKYGYATYCSVNPIDFSSTEGYTAWRVNSIASDGTITFKKITEAIKGGQGVLLYNKDADGENKTDVTINFADGTTEFDNDDSDDTNNNLLVGTTAPIYISGEKAYGLSGNKFVKNNIAGTIGENKAYIPADAIPAGVKAFNFVFEDEDDPDEIRKIENVSAEDAAQIFDLLGRRLNKMQKGINIVNGKKILR